MKILQEIKEINFGIQTIMITASNKSWNLQKAMDYGADRYLVKDIGTEDKSPIVTLKTNIDDCLQSAKKLKPIFTTLKDVITTIEKKYVNASEDNKIIGNELKSNVLLCSKLLVASKSKEDDKLAFISVFLCFELLVNKHIKEVEEVIQDPNKPNKKITYFSYYYNYNEKLISTVHRVKKDGKQVKKYSRKKEDNYRMSLLIKTGTLGIEIGKIEKQTITEFSILKDLRDKFVHSLPNAEIKDNDIKKLLAILLEFLQKLPILN